VVEVQIGADAPSEIAAFFKSGGEQTAIDTSGVITRNWLLAQIVGAAAYYGDNRRWIDELWQQTFYLQKVVHKRAGARWYVVFKGSLGMRKYISAARYGVVNAKVLSITGGAGSAQGLRHAAWDAAKGSLRKAGLIAVVFTITLDTAEWLGDYEQRDPETGKPKKDFFDLAAKIGVDLAKAGISAAVGAALMGGVIAVVTAIGVIAGSVAVISVGLVVVGAVGFSLFVGVSLDYLDKRFVVTDSVAKGARAAVAHLNAKHDVDYAGYEGVVSAIVAP
jgi:hypothetical protein